MARTANGVGPVQTAQIIFMTTPEIAGEVEAWREVRGINVKSEQFREIFEAGLAAKRKAWIRKHGELPASQLAAAVAGAVSGRAPKPAVVVAPVKLANGATRPRKRAARKTAA